jgi:arylsulfatase A-like enzyme
MWIFLLLLALVASNFAAAKAADAQPRRPNLLFIVTDDQRWDALGVVQREQGADARFPWFTTPNLDRLASEGARFRNAFVVHSLCSPSRASLLSGQYGHKNGIVDNVTPLSRRALNQAEILRKAGYRTAFIGKLHMDSQRERWGFDHIASYTGQGLYTNSTFLVNGHPERPPGWVDDIATDYAIDFMRTNTTQPWMMFLGYKAVHTPRTPPERARHRFDGESVKPAKNEHALPSYGQGQLALVEDVPPPYPPATGDKGGTNRYLINYFRTLSAMDDDIGRILAELDRLKLSDDTVVVFASDNGYFLGEHGLGDKRAAYEDGMRIPLLMRYPRMIAPGTLIDKMALNIDLAPTFLDLAGVAIPKEMQGASWVPLLKGHPNTAPWRNAFMFVYAYEPPLPSTPAMLAVRTDTAKLIVYPGRENWTELFDLKKDPYEMKNLAADPAHHSLLNDLQKELAAQKQRFGDPLSPPEIKPDK